MSRKHLVVLSAVGLLLIPSLGWAHPMGNFSISHYSALRIGEETIELQEKFAAGTIYHVRTRVELSGSLRPPAVKGTPGPA